MPTADRDSLECGWCGDVAVYADDDGMFSEDMADVCLSCGFVGHVSIDDADEEHIDIYWVTRDDDEAIIARWRAEHPEAAAQMDAEEARWKREVERQRLIDERRRRSDADR